MVPELEPFSDFASRCMQKNQLGNRSGGRGRRRGIPRGSDGTGKHHPGGKVGRRAGLGGCTRHWRD